MLTRDSWRRLTRWWLGIAAGAATVVVLACASEAVAQSVASVSGTVVVVTNTSDSVNGKVSSIAALNARPGRDGISLREALEAVNHTRGNATVYVMFTHVLNGRTIELRSGLPPIHRNHVVLEGLAPTGAPARVTIDGLRAPSSTTSWLLLVQASDVTVRWLRFTGLHKQGNPTGRMTALIVSAGTWKGPNQSVGPSTIAHVQIVDDVFDNSSGNRTPGLGEIGVIIGGGGRGCCVGRYSDITVARSTFLEYRQDDSLGVFAGDSGMSMSGIVIEDNTFDHDAAPDAGPIELAEAGIRPRQTKIRIIGNTMTGDGMPRSIAISFSAGNAIDATRDNTLIEGNTISDFENAININANAFIPNFKGFPNDARGDVTSNTQIVNNLIRQDSISPAIYIAGGGHSSSAPSRVSGVTIQNDTLVETGTAHGQLLAEFPGARGNYVTGVVIRNSIMYDPDGMPIAHGTFGQPPNAATAQPPDVVANSLIWGPTLAGGNTTADPHFANLASGDYHLAAGSPGINTGTRTGAPPFDYDGARRDATPDIGAFEFGVAPRPQLNVTVYPLRGSGTVASSPAGINCSIGCIARFDLNTNVTLAAKPANRSRFLGWLGACSGTRRCTITLEGNRSVTARFGPR